MDTPITRAEHEEFRKTVNSEIDRLREEDKRQNRRIEELENTTRQINSLTVSVERLAVNMESMLQELTAQGARLKTLEGRDGDMWRKVVGYAITAVVGIAVGFIFTQIGM